MQLMNVTTKTNFWPGMTEIPVKIILQDICAATIHRYVLIYLIHYPSEPGLSEKFS